MTTTRYAVLGQSNPAANTAVSLYTVPAATSTVVSTLTVCNQAGAPALFRVAVRPAGAALDPKHYLAYDSPLNQSDMIALTLGITLGTGDVVTVQANSATVSFGLYGSELS